MSKRVGNKKGKAKKRVARSLPKVSKYKKRAKLVFDPIESLMKSNDVI